MRETRPLLEENATDIEKVLLRAGRTEEPDRLASARLVSVLQGLPPAPGVMEPGAAQTAGPASSGMAATAAAHSAATWVKVGVLALGLGGAGVATHHLARPHSPAPSAPAVKATTGGSTHALPGAAPSAEPARPYAPEPLPLEDHTRVRKAVPGPRVREAILDPLPGSTFTRPHSLAEETKALDRARDSLEAHRFAEALRLLGEYHRQFPDGRMRPEATVLRLTALIKSGQHDAARSLADRLLADETYKTYAARIRSLLRQTQP